MDDVEGLMDLVCRQNIPIIVAHEICDGLRTLAAENQRLRGALEEISNWSVEGFWLNNTTHCRSGLEDAVSTARQALQEQP